jgi:hypothetical protein
VTGPDRAHLSFVAISAFGGKEGRRGRGWQPWRRMRGEGSVVEFQGDSTWDDGPVSESRFLLSPLCLEFVDGVAYWYVREIVLWRWEVDLGFVGFRVS